MAYPFINGLPGTGNTLTSSTRNILRSLDGLKRIPGGVVIDGTLSGDWSNTPQVNVLTSGLLFGKVTATGKYAPTIIGILQSDAASGATALTVSAAQAVELVRRVGASGTFKLTGNASAGASITTQTVTYSSVNTSTGVITCTAIAAAVVKAGAYATGSDGSETPISVLWAATGLRVDDFTGTRSDQPTGGYGDLLISADLIGANLPDFSLLSADTKASVKALLNGSGRTFTFAEDY